MKISRFSAVLTLFLSSQSHAQEGIWKIESPVSFAKIARLQTLSARGENFSARAVFPIFRARTPLARFANFQIAEAEKKHFRQWLREKRADLKADFQPIAPYEYQSVPSLSYYSPTLISLRFDFYQYLGGAHGMAIRQTRNFALMGGKPKELVLGDLFPKGTNYRALVEQKIFAQLRRNPNAAWVQDKSVKKLENEQFNNFSISQNAVTWHFAPYEMGPYAAGEFEVKIPKSELGLVALAR